MTTQRVGRRRVAFAAALCGLLLVLLLVSCPRLTPRGMTSSSPTILLSLDRTFWHRMGLSRWTYVRALTRAGARVEVLDYSSETEGEGSERAARRLLDGVDGLVLSGGGDVDPSLYDGSAENTRGVRPERDRFELALLAEAEARGLPILGICRGAQLLNVARGGTLETIRGDRELRRRHGRYRWHPVELEGGSLLARLLETDSIARVVSYHGQAVDRPGEGLVIVGRAADGVVEAIEAARPSEGPWLLGVQWHPELSPRNRLHRKLFSSLVEAARSSRPDEPSP